LGENCLLVKKKEAVMRNKNLVLTTKGNKIYVDNATLRKMQRKRTIVCVYQYADDDLAS